MYSSSQVGYAVNPVNPQLRRNLMIVFYASRTAARAVSFGSLVDNGPDAPKGQRFGRKVSGISGNARQRRQMLRRVMAQS
jgi:hypothetical protein